MDEGKDARPKPKWWSRPRRGLDGRPADGAHTARPEPDAAAEEASEATVGEAHTGHAAAPLSGLPPAAGEPWDTPTPDPDSRSGRTADASAGPAAPNSSTGADAAAQPEAREGTAPGDGGGPQGHGDSAADTAPLPGSGGPESAHGPQGAAPDAGHGPQGEQPGGGASGTGQPLHKPDPYATPPYGRPGPWAPAPPVQRPVPTPPHGTHIPPAPAQLPAPTGHWQQYDPWAPPRTETGAGGERRVSRGNLLAGALVLALVSGGIGGGIGASLERSGGVAPVELPQAPMQAQNRAPGSVAGIAAKALPGVVTIHVRGGSEQGTGTGFVLDKYGHILTNNHVVQPAGSGGEISVTFNSGDVAKARVVGRDTGYDLAVVKVSGVPGLKPLALGNSDSVRVGDPVVAIGAPFDLAGTVTSGIISAKQRPITAGGESGGGSDVSYVDALQTDAPINPGNSGGPLVDSGARVIGINSAIRAADNGTGLGGQGGSIGLGFAIPINQGKRVAEELINKGKATHPVIGVTLNMGYTGDGARVSGKEHGASPVTPGGPADKAGIRPGDVITEVDGTPVHSGEELIVKIRSHRPGDKLTLTLKRDGKRHTVRLTLGSANGDR